MNGKRKENGTRFSRIPDMMRDFCSWLLTNIVIAVPVICFFVLFTKTRIYGRSRIPLGRNSLLLGNHQSMIDSFPIGFAAFYPWTLLRPYLIPWHAAAEENFFRNPLQSWLFARLKCIPVRRGRRDPKAFRRSLRALRGSTMVLFPEGTRSRDGALGGGRPGPGLIALATHPSVVPVTIEGMDRILPIGRKVPRIGQRVSIYFGRPIDYGDIVDKGRSRASAQELVDRVMGRIAFQQRVLARLSRAK